MGSSEFRIWDGVHDRFPETDGSVPEAFNSSRWLDSLAERVAAKSAETGAPVIPDHTLVHEYPLPQLVAPLTVDPGQSVRILDFGGGLGDTFLDLVASLSFPDRVDFHIVESSGVCERGRDLLSQYGNLHFRTELPPASTERFDIVHAASSLHYVEAWREMLATFASYKPHSILLSGLTAGDIETFVTHQNYYGSRIPVWFWNVHEIIDAVQGLGYSLVYRSLLAFSYLGKVQNLPMEHFPATHQLRRKCNLLFCVGRGAGR